MNLSNIFSKLTSLLVGKKAVDMKAGVMGLYPDAMVLNDIFPKSPLNVTFVVLPGVASGTLPDNLKGVIQRNDGTVTFVFTGDSAVKIKSLVSNPAAMAGLLAEKLLAHTKIDEALTKVMDQITGFYNKVMPGEDVTSAQAIKKVLGMAGMFLAKQEAFKNAQEFYKALLTKFIVDGQLAIDMPEAVSAKLKKLGMDKLASNPAAAVAVQVVESQINTVLEQALKGLKGDVQVY